MCQIGTYNTIYSPFYETDTFSSFPSLSAIGQSVVLYYTEDELRQFLDNLKSKNIKEGLFQDTVKQIIANRHCSEEFILDYLTIDTSKVTTEFKVLLLKQHSSDILSGTYSQLALILELTDSN